MTRTRWIVAAAFVACACLGGTAQAQVDPEAKKVLDECAAAWKNAPSMTFHSKRYATSMLKDIIDSDGTVMGMRPKGATSPIWRVEGRIKQPAQADKHLTLVYDGTTAKWLSESDNTYYERPITDTLAVQEIGMSDQLLPKELLEKDLFGVEFKFDKLMKAPQDTLHGEVCDIIVATSNDGIRARTWAVSVKDRLPRRMDFSAGAAGQKIDMILDIWDFKTTALTDKDFVINLPVGFRKDVQAPMPAVAAAPGAMNPAAPAVELGLKTGTDAPDFNAKDSTGKDVGLSKMKNNVVVLEFWGSIFKQSTAHSAEMQAIADQYKGKNVKIVGVACREATDKAALAYWKDNSLSYTLIPMGDKIAQDYKVMGFPTYYVIDGHGKIAAYFQSNPGKDKFTAAIEAAMGASK